MSESESESIDIVKGEMKNIIDITVAGEGLQNLREKWKKWSSLKHLSVTV